MGVDGCDVVALIAKPSRETKATSIHGRRASWFFTINRDTFSARSGNDTRISGVETDEQNKFDNTTGATDVPPGVRAESVRPVAVFYHDNYDAREITILPQNCNVECLLGPLFLGRLGKIQMLLFIGKTEELYRIIHADGDGTGLKGLIPLDHVVEGSSRTRCEGIRALDGSSPGASEILWILRVYGSRDCTIFFAKLEVEIVHWAKHSSLTVV